MLGGAVLLCRSHRPTSLGENRGLREILLAGSSPHSPMEIPTRLPIWIGYDAHTTSDALLSSSISTISHVLVPLRSRTWMVGTK